MARQDPYRNFRFRIEIDGIQTAGFSEVTIGRDDDRRRRLPRRHGPHTCPEVLRPDEIRQRHAETRCDGLAGAVQLAQADRERPAGRAGKTVVIVVQDEAGADKARYVVSDAWPIKYDPGDLNAKGNDVFIETLELVNEGVERVQ